MALRRCFAMVIEPKGHVNASQLSPISIVTHLSDDRLPQLARLLDSLNVKANTHALILTVCAAVFISYGGKTKAGKIAKVMTSLHELHGSNLILQASIFSPGRATNSKIWYPINKLRNEALSLAKTDLVLICDVDFLPCKRLGEIARTPGVCAGLLEACAGELTCIVLPAFEALPFANTDNHHEGRLGDCQISQVEGRFDGLDWIAESLETKQDLIRECFRERIIPFGSRVWEQGHRATMFERWKYVEASYEVSYEEGFEPFVIMHRGLVPPFDERFEGYGRNKVIFFFLLQALGFNFSVHPHLYLVHYPHSPSNSRLHTFKDGSTRLADILDLYALAKREILVDIINKDPHSRDYCRLRDWCTTWSWGQGRLPCSLGHWGAKGADRLCSVATGTTALPQHLQRSLMASMHLLWFKYQPKPVQVVGRLVSDLRRDNADITIVTQCSFSRLDRLERMCSRWTGVVSAALISDGVGGFSRHEQCAIRMVHQRLEALAACRLDVSLCQLAAGPAKHDGLYPMNALRNVAMAAAKTDLVFLLVRPKNCGTPCCTFVFLAGVLSILVQLYSNVSLPLPTCHHFKRVLQ
ncbi:unnamed protein product [Choristocarpus tenellus]